MRRDNGTGATPAGACDDTYLDGALDEIRLEHVARSQAWIACSFAAMQDRVIDYGAP